MPNETVSEPTEESTTEPAPAETTPVKTTKSVKKARSRMAAKPSKKAKADEIATPTPPFKPAERSGAPK